MYLIIPLLRVRRWRLVLCDYFPPDTVSPIELTQFPSRDLLVWELAVVEHTALIQCFRCPCLQGLLTLEELFLLRVDAPLSELLLVSVQK